MIVVSYLKRIGYDWYRAVNEYKDTDKAKSFISFCLEDNKKKGDKRLYRNFRIFVSCKRATVNELLNL